MMSPLLYEWHGTLHITKTIFLIQGKDFHEFCDIDFAFAISFMVLVLATSCQLVLVSGERYLAIKHTFTHANVVTNARRPGGFFCCGVDCSRLFLSCYFVFYSLFICLASSGIFLDRLASSSRL